MNESVTKDLVFPELVRAISVRCASANLPVGQTQLSPQALHEARAEGDRLILADICARLSFVVWLTQTFQGLTAEQLLLAQLNGGRTRMVQAFEYLLTASVTSLNNLAFYCRNTLVYRWQQPIRVAIDEAQMAAPKFAGPDGFYFQHVEKKSPRGLLDEYCHQWINLFERRV